MSSTEPVVFPIYRDLLPSQSRTVTDDLVVCDFEKAPQGFEKHRGASTRVLCKLVVNLSSVPAHLWEPRQSPSGRQCQRLNYQLGMQIESGGLRFDMRVDDVVYGNVTAKFE